MKGKQTMLTPAYAMNTKNAGTEFRTCTACAKTHEIGKTSKVTVCGDCLKKLNSKHCRRCATTGRFITGMTNGVPTGPGGACFRCQDKGYQAAKDMRRNAYYAAHRPVHF